MPSSQLSSIGHLEAIFEAKWICSPPRGSAGPITLSYKDFNGITDKSKRFKYPLYLLGKAIKVVPGPHCFHFFKHFLPTISLDSLTISTSNSSSTPSPTHTQPQTQIQIKLKSTTQAWATESVNSRKKSTTRTLSCTIRSQRKPGSRGTNLSIVRPILLKLNYKEEAKIREFTDILLPEQNAQ